MNMNVLRIYSDKILTTSDKKLFKDCDLTLTRTAEGVVRVTRVPDDCRKITLKVVEFVFCDCMVAWNTDAPVRLADALKKRVKKSNVTRHKRAAKNAAPRSEFTARNVNGETIELAAPAQVVHERVRPSIDGTNELNDSIAADLFMTAWKLGARVPSVELFRNAAAHADNDFEAESFRLAEKLCRRIYR